MASKAWALDPSALTRDDRPDAVFFAERGPRLVAAPALTGPAASKIKPRYVCLACSRGVDILAFFVRVAGSTMELFNCWLCELNDNYWSGL